MPWIVRYLDREAAGVPEGQLAPVEGWLGVVEDETETTREEIRGLLDLIDADLADPTNAHPEQLLMLSLTLGMGVGSDRGKPFQRWLINNLVHYFRIHGTIPAFEKY